MVLIHLLPLLKEKTEMVEIESITSALKIERSKELWHQLKINSFVRPLVSVYFTTLLACFTTLQLSLLGRQSYIASVENLYKDELIQECGECMLSSCVSCSEKETERSFLTLSWFILNVGFAKGLEAITAAVETIMEDKPLNLYMNYEQLCTCMLEIRAIIEQKPLFLLQASNQVSDMLDYQASVSVTDMVEVEAKSKGSDVSTAQVTDMTTWIMPVERYEATFLAQAGLELPEISKHMQELIDETRDFIESAQFKHITGKCLDAAFGTYMDTVYPSFYPPTHTAFGGRLEFESGLPSADVAESKSIPLARILPIMSNSSTKAIFTTPYPLCKNLMQVVELKAFAVIVYTSFD